MKKISLIFAGVLMGMAGLSAGEGMALTQDGKATAEIVLPARANRIEKYAAKELQEHLFKSSGATLEIVRENKRDGQKNGIHLGATEFARQRQVDGHTLPINGYYKKITPDSVILAGHDGNGTLPGDDTTSMGTLFAVYDFLENNLGARWLWPGDSGTIIPRYDSLRAGKNEDKKVIPQLLHSRMRDGTDLGAWQGLLSEDEYKQAKLERQIWLRRQRFARGTSFEYGHGFEQFWKRFGESRPDFFALRPDGKRTPYDQRHDLVQLCVSNPALHRQIVEDWLQNRQSYKGDFINGCENDKRFEDGHCICANCLAWDPDPSKTNKIQYHLDKDGNSTVHFEDVPNNLSDRYAKFWLALQAEAKKSRENPVVIGYAYFDYSNPPTATKLNSDIIVGTVQNFDYPLDAANRSAFRDQWAGWSNTGARLYLRPNYFLAGYTLPYIFASQFGEDYKFAYDHGMVGTDFDSLTAMFGTQGPNLYMVARLNADPSRSIDEILTEYYQSFGKAAPKVKEYFEFWENLTSRRDNAFTKQYPEGGWNPMGYSGNKLFTLADTEKAGVMLQEAQVLVQNSPEDSARIAFLQKGLRHTVLTLATMNAFDDWKKERGNAAKEAAFRTALRELDQYRDEIRNDQVINIVLVKKLEQWMGWRSR